MKRFKKYKTILNRKEKRKFQRLSKKSSIKNVLKALVEYDIECPHGLMVHTERSLDKDYKTISRALWLNFEIEYFNGSLTTYYIKDINLINFIKSSCEINVLKEFLLNISATMNCMLKTYKKHFLITQNQTGKMIPKDRIKFGGVITFPIDSELDAVSFLFYDEGGDILLCARSGDQEILIPCIKKHVIEIVPSDELFKFIVGFCIYMDIFPEAVKDGFIFDTRPGLLPKGKHVSITAHPKIIQSHSHNSPTPHLRRGHFAFLNSPRFVNKQGQFVWRESTFVKGKAKSVVTV